MVGKQHGRDTTTYPWRVHRLRDGPRNEDPAKARWLAEAAAAGLDVPAGWIHPLGWSAPLENEVRAALAEGPLIVRAALRGEDEAEHSAAGLGRSVGELHTVAAVREAIEEVANARDDPWLQRYRETHRTDTDATDVVVVQRQIERDTLIVAALLPSGLCYIETHTAAGDVLATGATPAFAGLLERWPNQHAAAVEQTCADVVERLPPPALGFDVELVVDPGGRVHVVQVRPLTTDLEADGRAFLAAVAHAGHSDRLGGVLHLDAEHNPEPLGAAHASLMAWLTEQRPRSGGLTTLAGWLYVRTKVRDLGAPDPDALTPHQALVLLRDTHLSAARQRLAEVEQVLGSGAQDAIIQGLRRAQSAFLAMIDIYLGVLVPVRAAAGRVIAARPDAPFSLQGRAGFADVLPTTWDIAAPSLAELHSFAADERIETLPEDPAEAAVLLTEWDDHLFALGLAPLRRVYLAAAERLGLGDAVFGLTLTELPQALAGRLPDAAARGRARERRRAQWARLRPPARIDEGRPLPALPRYRWRGIAFGESFEGVVEQRAGLEALLRDPPAPTSIVVLPALTAPAALALHALGLRAVCCEHGGALSHAALMMRELQLNGLVGCLDCTRFPDGVRARIDVPTGRLQIASSVTPGS